METKINKIRFTVTACKWFDKKWGNTYHSVMITRCKDGAMLSSGSELVYGYGDHYQQTARELMHKSGWIRNKKGESLHCYDRTRNYPIEWNVSDTTKREAMQNGL